MAESSLRRARRLEGHASWSDVVRGSPTSLPGRDVDGDVPVCQAGERSSSLRAQSKCFERLRADRFGLSLDTRRRRFESGRAFAHVAYRQKRRTYTVQPRDPTRLQHIDSSRAGRAGLFWETRFDPGTVRATQGSAGVPAHQLVCDTHVRYGPDADGYLAKTIRRHQLVCIGRSYILVTLKHTSRKEVRHS